MAEETTKLETMNEPEAKKTEEKPKAEPKKEKKEEKRQEKEFIIPLRSKFKNIARYKKTPKAIREIKKFLLRNMKIYDRDLKKIKLDKYLNEFMWSRGIKNPPAKVKVRAFMDGEFVRAELADLNEEMKFKKARLEKREKTSPPAKKTQPEKPEIQEKTEEEKAVEKEKKASVIEAGKKMEKAASKQARHMGKEKPMQPKHQRRMALEK